MPSVKLSEAAGRLPELIAGLNPGQQLIIVSGDQPVATLTRATDQLWPCKAGSAKDTTHWMADDFDAPLDDFKEYSE